MKFQPKSEAEFATAGLWPASIVDFEVIEATDEISKSSGAEMVKLKIYLFNDRGEKRTVFDYLVSSEKALFKVHQFAKATGLLGAYEAGEMEALDMQGRTGRCKIAIQSDPQYGDKNVIREYLPQSSMSPAPLAPAPARSAPRGGGSIESDEIPFASCWQ